MSITGIKRVRWPNWFINLVICIAFLSETSKQPSSTASIQAEFNVRRNEVLLPCNTYSHTSPVKGNLLSNTGIKTKEKNLEEIPAYIFYNGVFQRAELLLLRKLIIFHILSS